MPGVVPIPDIFDNPSISICLNSEWASFIDARVGQLLDRALWEGTDDEVDRAIDQINLFLAKLGEVGVCALTPVGAIMMWPVDTAPDGWLKCQGQSLVRADYVDLFAVLGTLYGTVDSTHFNLPDYRQRSPYGVGSTGLTIGQTAGSATTTIPVGALPAHNHRETVFAANDAFVAAAAGGSNRTIAAGTNTTGTTPLNTGNTGNGDPISVLHPIIMTNYIIFTGV